jgi:hypothetical protein
VATTTEGSPVTGSRARPVVDTLVAHSFGGYLARSTWMDGQRRLATLSPRSYVQVVRETGHQVPTDAPRAIADAVLKLLDQGLRDASRADRPRGRGPAETRTGSPTTPPSSGPAAAQLLVSSA